MFFLPFSIFFTGSGCRCREHSTREGNLQSVSSPGRALLTGIKCSQGVLLEYNSIPGPPKPPQTPPPQHHCCCPATVFYRAQDLGVPSELSLYEPQLIPRLVEKTRAEQALIGLLGKTQGKRRREKRRLQHLVRVGE